MATSVVFGPTVGPDLKPGADIEKFQAVLDNIVEVSLKSDKDKLIVSPYTEEPHLLDLKTLDTTNQILAKALASLKCLRVDYATAPYDEIFNVSNLKSPFLKKNPLL